MVTLSLEIVTFFLAVPAFHQLQITVSVSPKSMEQMALPLLVQEQKLRVLET